MKRARSDTSGVRRKPEPWGWGDWRHDVIVYTLLVLVTILYPLIWALDWAALQVERLARRS